MEKINVALNECVEENIGMEMIFSLVGCAQELLNTLFDQIKVDREQQKMKQEVEKEKIERKKFEGEELYFVCYKLKIYRFACILWR